MKKIISFEKKLEFPSMIGEVTAISLDHNLTFVDECNITGEFSISGNYKLTEASRLEEKFDYQVPADIIMNEKIDLSTAKIDIDDFYYEIENDDSMICYIDVKIEGVEQIEEPEELSPSVERILEDEETKNADRCIELEPIKIENSEIKNDDSCTELEQITVEPIKTESVVIETEVRECDGDPKVSDVTVITREEKEPMESENMKEEQQEILEKEVAMGSLFSSLKESDETFASYSVYILRQEESVQSIIEKYKTTKEELESYNDLSNLTTGTKIIIPAKNES